MTQAELYRAEARAWRKLAPRLDHDSEVVLLLADNVRSAMFARWLDCGGEIVEYNNGQVLFCLFLALEAEDDARECA